MTDRLIRMIAALAVATVAAVAAIISYRHAFELVSTHGETGLTAQLVPFTVDGLIVAASMLILDANRRSRSAPALAHWCLAVGIIATICANLAHGIDHGPIGAMVSAWPALALAGSFELLMLLIRIGRQATTDQAIATPDMDSAQELMQQHASPALSLEQVVKIWHKTGQSQRAIARELSIDRRKVKQIIDNPE